MIAIKKKTIIRFTLALSFFSGFYAGVVGVLYVPEIVDDIESHLSRRLGYDWEGHMFDELGEDGRKIYCKLTWKVFRGRRLIEDMGQTNFLTKIYKYRNTYVVECKTLPIVFLRYESHDSHPRGYYETIKFFVMIEKNKYMDGPRKFHFDTIESDPVMSCIEHQRSNNKTDGSERSSAELHAKSGKTVRLECEEEAMKASSPLATLSRFKRLHLCTAAKNHQNGVEPLIFLDNEVKTAQLYEFSYAEDKTETRIALECPTRPPMYVYFRDLQVNEDLQVIIVEKKKGTLNGSRLR